MKRMRTVTCDRERRWISLALDGELSELERAMMAAHLERCGECRAYADDVRGFTVALRSAPPEPVRNRIWHGAPERARAARMRLRIAPVASAAAAIAAAFIGVTAIADRGSVTGADRAATGTRLSDGSLVNELVLAIRRPRLAEGTQAVVPAAPSEPAAKPPLSVVPGV